MATFARVTNGIVREVYKGDKLFEMHATIAAQWHVAEDDTLEGYTFDGKVFAAPVAPVIDPKVEAKNQIAVLEAQITPRRVREAVLGDNGWLKNIDGQIAALRAKL